MTFSITARCARSGMFGIGVTSSSPAVASRCAWARAGIGAVSTQNITDPTLGNRGLDLMAAGKTDPSIHMPHGNNALSEENVAAISLSVAGSHTSRSMPFRIPTKRSPMAMNEWFRPNPPALVLNSWACVGLTVVA